MTFAQTLAAERDCDQRTKYQKTVFVPKETRSYETKDRKGRTTRHYFTTGGYSQQIFVRDHAQFDACMRSYGLKFFPTPWTREGQ